MALITLDVLDPTGTQITSGTITAVADKNDNGVLKGSSTSATPGAAVTLTLVNNDYKIYYTDSDAVKQYVGTITVTANATITSLLDEVA